MGKRGQEKKQGRKEDFAEVHFPFRTCWGDSVSTAPLAGGEPASPNRVLEPVLYHLKLPEAFQEHPAELEVPASQDTAEKLNLFLVSRGTGIGWWAWQMKLLEEMLQSLRSQGKAGVGGDELS